MIAQIRTTATSLVLIPLLGFLVLEGCRQGQDKSAAAAVDPPNAAAAKHRKILYWKSSMDPAFIAKSPGKDSMGMDLVPVYEGEQAASEPGAVRIDPATEQNIGVKTVTVHRQPLTHTIRTVARITYDDSKVRNVTPKIGGWVEQQHVNFPGQIVAKGEPLVSIYSPKLVSTEEEYLLALRYRRQLSDSVLGEASADAGDLLKSAEIRLRYWDISDAQIKALRDSGTIARTMVLHAPFKGIVLSKDVLEGGYVEPGHSLYTLADISTVWVYADVYEYEAPWIKLGQQATMTLSYQPGVSYRGRVVYIYPYLKEQTRTLQVRMEFRNSRDFSLKPGMWADVTLDSSITREGVAVPVQAVIRTGTRDIALLALGDGRFAPRELKLGAQAGNDFEVLSGLNDGDKVVTSAQFLIDSESSLQAAISKMLDSNHDADNPAPAAQPAQQGGSMAPMNMPKTTPSGPDRPQAQMQPMPGMNMPGMNKNEAGSAGMDMNMPGMDMGAHGSQMGAAPGAPRR